LARVQVGDLWGFINTTGKFIVKPQFSYVYMFSEGLAAIKLNNKWGYIFQTGETVIKPQFDNIGPFSDGLARVYTEREEI
jgi:hypothetical protein